MTLVLFNSADVPKLLVRAKQAHGNRMVLQLIMLAAALLEHAEMLYLSDNPLAWH
jgi:hypothetical protein